LAVVVLRCELESRRTPVAELDGDIHQLLARDPSGTTAILAS
jgi:hypothetical protein